MWKTTSSKEIYKSSMPTTQMIRHAARTVIFDVAINKIAVLEVKGGDYHKIPGGGVEDNESLEETAMREALEEAACGVEIITKLGEAQFDSPEFGGQINHSVCFLARKIKGHKSTDFTQEETKENFKLLWVTIFEAIALFKNVKSKDPFELNMNNRDLNFVLQAEKYLQTKNFFS